LPIQFSIYRSCEMDCHLSFHLFDGLPVGLLP
jgi:hypothetical protein